MGTTSVARLCGSFAVVPKSSHRAGQTFFLFPTCVFEIPLSYVIAIVDLTRKATIWRSTYTRPSR